jgi:hypothetical protein
MKRSSLVSLLAISSVLAILALGASAVAQAAPHGMLRTIQQRDLFNEMKAATTPPHADENTVLYYGGPVIGNVKVYAVMWGPNVDTTTQQQISGYFTAVVKSTYIDWLSEYNTTGKAVDGRQGTNQTIGRGTFGGLVTIAPVNSAKTLQDTDIQAEIDHQIDGGVLPHPDANTLFMVYFPPGIKIELDGSESCSAFCAYHLNYTSKTYGTVLYGVMPDLGGMCSFGCGFLSNRFDSLTAVSSHELVEAITDPIPTPGSTPAYPQAWNTDDGNEVGDLCTEHDTQLTAGSTNYQLQQIFDNSIHDCAPGPYTSSAQ